MANGGRSSGRKARGSSAGNSSSGNYSGSSSSVSNSAMAPSTSQLAAALEATPACVFEQMGLTPEATRNMSLVDMVRQCIDYSQRLTDEIRRDGVVSPEALRVAAALQDMPELPEPPAGISDAALAKLRTLLASWPGDALEGLRAVSPAPPGSQSSTSLIAPANGKTSQAARLMQPRTFLESMLFITDVSMSTVDMAMCLDPVDFFPAPLLFAVPAVLHADGGASPDMAKKASTETATALFDLQHRVASLFALALVHSPSAVYPPHHFVRGQPPRPSARTPLEGDVWSTGAASLAHGEGVAVRRNFFDAGLRVLARAVLRFAPAQDMPLSSGAAIGRSHMLPGDFFRTTLPTNVLQEMVRMPRPDLAARTSPSLAPGEAISIADLALPSASDLAAHWRKLDGADRAAFLRREQMRLHASGAVPAASAPAGEAPSCGCSCCAGRVLGVAAVFDMFFRAYHSDLGAMADRFEGRGTSSSRPATVREDCADAPLPFPARCRVALYAALERLADEIEDCRGNGLVTILKRIRRILDRRQRVESAPPGAITASFVLEDERREGTSGGRDYDDLYDGVDEDDDHSCCGDACAHHGDECCESDDEDMEAFYEDFNAMEDEDVLAAEGDLPVDAPHLSTAFPHLYYYSDNWSASEGPSTPATLKDAEACAAECHVVPTLLGLDSPRGADGPQLYAVLANMLLQLALAPAAMEDTAGARQRQMLAELEQELLADDDLAAGVVGAPQGKKAAKKKGGRVSTPPASSVTSAVPAKAASADAKSPKGREAPDTAAGSKRAVSSIEPATTAKKEESVLFKDDVKEQLPESLKPSTMADEVCRVLHAATPAFVAQHGAMLEDVVSHTAPMLFGDADMCEAALANLDAAAVRLSVSREASEARLALLDAWGRANRVLAGALSEGAGTVAFARLESRRRELEDWLFADLAPADIDAVLVAMTADDGTIDQRVAAMRLLLVPHDAPPRAVAQHGGATSAPLVLENHTARSAVPPTSVEAHVDEAMQRIADNVTGAVLHRLGLASTPEVVTAGMPHDVADAVLHRLGLGSTPDLGLADDDAPPGLAVAASPPPPLPSGEFGVIGDVVRSLGLDDCAPADALVPSRPESPPMPSADARPPQELSGEAPAGASAQASGWFESILGPAMGSLWSPLAGLRDAPVDAVLGAHSRSSTQTSDGILSVLSDPGVVAVRPEAPERARSVSPVAAAIVSPRMSSRLVAVLDESEDELPPGLVPRS